MNIVDITNILKSLGWSASRDEVGDRVASYRLLDRTVNIIYSLKRLPNAQQLSIMQSASTEAFSSICAKIDPGYGVLAPLVVPWNSPVIRVPEVLEGHIFQASDDAIAWARQQNLDQALQQYAALPTDAPGAQPIWHLAALVLLGDVATLKLYQFSFEIGDRLGFVNYITKDYIDRAVTLAEERTINQQ